MTSDVTPAAGPAIELTTESLTTALSELMTVLKVTPNLAPDGQIASVHIHGVITAPPNSAGAGAGVQTQGIAERYRKVLDLIEAAGISHLTFPSLFIDGDVLHTATGTSRFGDVCGVVDMRLSAVRKEAQPGA